MRNNKLILYKANIFTKISQIFNQIFFRKKEHFSVNTEEQTFYNKNKNYFVESILIKENQEHIRLKKLQMQYDNGEIEEENISGEDMDKLIEMYEKETAELNRDTENIKTHISQMLKELKKS